MGREAPFNPKAVCDECGKLGAFDFYGDCFCAECIEKFEQEAAIAEQFGANMAMKYDAE